MTLPSIPVRFLIVSLLLLSAAGLLGGCEDNATGVYFGGNHPGGETSHPVGGTLPGSWELVSASGDTWYVHFNKDGSWQITDDAGGQVRRVSGHYSTRGSSFKGDMVNPGVGDGEINGAWNGDSITLNFIEHWHTPYKVVPYTGSRL